MSAKKSFPSRKEIFDFMIREAQPYRFEYVEHMEPLRVNVERKTIYVNEKVLISVIKELTRAGLDWKEIMRKNIKHEKAHEKYFKWNLKWRVGGAEHGWLASYLTDIAIDRIHFANDKNYQKWLLQDSRQAYKDIGKELRKLFPTLSSRPHFLYNQAAYWIAIRAITLEEAVDIYPEKANYVTDMSRLFDSIKSEEDLEWAYSKALRIYLGSFGDAQS
jgi:hypothetical protein